MDILYHYCPTASFLSIAQSRSLWLSSLSLSNDTMEGKLVLGAITRLSERDSLNQESLRHLQETIGMFEELFDGLGFCLSEDGDLLSQWRGYAADATGVAIGFSTGYLDWLSKESLTRAKPGFMLEQVKYEPSAHEQCVEPTYLKAKAFIDGGAFTGRNMLSPIIRRSGQEKANAQLSKILLPIYHELFCLKAPAFREEREWRLLSHLIKDAKDPCSHRAAHDRIIPYRKFELTDLEREPISEVILGPKHSTPQKLVEDFLKQHGYGSVRIRRSDASYR